MSVCCANYNTELIAAVKTLKNDEKNVEANNNNKTTLNPNVGANNNF